MAEQTLSKRKKTVFTIITYLTPVIFFILLELGLQIANYGGNTNLFIKGPEDMPNYYRVNPDVGKRYFFMQNTVPQPSKDLLLKEKPENGYRIFVMGGSTAAGFPYGNNIRFSRILNKQLSDIFPEKKIEIVSVAMAAVNTFTLLDFMDEILVQDPDLILIYAGHNEYYGALGVGSRESLGRQKTVIQTYLKLKRYKTFVLARDIIGKFKVLIGKITKQGSQIDPTNTLMARIVSDQTIPYKSELYDLGKKQFQTNLDAILEKAANKNVPVILSELVSNIRDQKPFISVKTEIDSLPTANKAFNVAKQLDEQQNYVDAKVAYNLAKDLDALRFRASSEFNDIIHQKADKYNTLVVPMLKAFQEVSPNGLIGDNIMTDHLHPTKDGYFLMAEAFLQTMKNNFISTNWNMENHRPLQDYIADWGYTELDSADAALGIHYLKGSWPFQPKNLPNRSLENFEFNNILDSLAYKILVTEYSLEPAHIELANYYKKRGMLDKAFLEYKALIHSIPYEIMFYENAAQILLRQKKFNQAKEILHESLNYKESFWVLKSLGKVYLLEGEKEKALSFLDKAYELKQNDKELNNIRNKLGL